MRSIQFLLALLLAAGPRLGAALLATCPDDHRKELEEYAKWHAENKNKPESTYVVWGCWVDDCSGTGDRVRGMMWSLRVAIAYRKVFIVDWSNPAQVTDFFLPNEIDWRGHDIDKSLLHRANEISQHEFWEGVYKGLKDRQAKFNTSKTYTTITNEHFFFNEMPGITAVGNELITGACYFHFLFKINQNVIDRGEELLKKIYPEQGPFVAWHWRHYDADGGEERPVKLSALHHALHCAQRMAERLQVDLNKKPTLLITDFNIARRMVLEGMINRVTTTDIVARHIDVVKAPSTANDPKVDGVFKDSNTFRDIFVDLYVMSRASCLLTSRSGFSKTAIWMNADKLIHCHEECGHVSH